MKLGQVLLALFWTVVTLLLYYWIHKPVTPDVVRVVGGAALDLGSTVLMIVIAGGIGRRVITVFLAENWETQLSRPERLAGEALLGLGIFSLAIFVVGLVTLHLFFVMFVWVTLAMLNLRYLVAWLGELTGWLRDFQPENNWQRFLAFFISVNIGMALLMSLAPPTKFDALVYQLLGAKLWIIEGRFVSIPESHFFAFPQLLNTLYTGQAALLDGRLTAAASLHGFLAILTFMAVGGYAARRFTPVVGWVAVAILLTVTSWWLQMSWAYADLAAPAFGILAFIALDEWRRDQLSTRWVILGGIFIGLTMATKYNAIGAGIALSAYVLLVARDSRVVVFVLAASLVMAPWLLRNWAFYDNPVYPFGPEAGEWDEVSSEWYFNTNDEVLQRDGWQYALILFTPTFLGVEGGPGFNTTIGPLFVLLIPMLFLTWRGLDATWRTSMRGMFLIIVIVHVFWVFSNLSRWTPTRLVFFMFPLLAILAAIALESLRNLPKKPLDFAWVMQVMVGLVLVLTLIDHVVGTQGSILAGTTLDSHFIESQALEYLAGTMDEDEYLDERLGLHIVAMRTVNDLPDGSRILFLWETRSLYCDEPRITCEEDEIILRYFHDRRTQGEAEAIVEQWSEEGFTHVLVWHTGRNAEFSESTTLFTDEDQAEWERIPPLLDEIERVGASYSLYAVAAEQE